MKLSFTKKKTLFLLLFFIFTLNRFVFANENMVFSWSLKEVYDDNITYIQKNKKQDLITKVKLAYTTKLSTRKNLFEFSGSVNQDVFSKYSKNNYSSQALNLSCLSEFTKYSRINISDSYYQTYEPRSFEESFDKQIGRYNFYNNKFSIRYSHDITSDFSFSSKYLNETNNYTKIYSINNNYSNSLELQGNYIISPLLDLNLFLNVSKRSFMTGDFSYSDIIYVELLRYFTKNFFIGGATGVNYIMSYDNSKFTKPFFSGSLTKVSEKGEMRLSVLNEYTTSSYSRDILNQWKLSANFNRQLAEKHKLISSAFYGFGKYVIYEVIDENTGISLGYEYDMLYNLKSNISYSLSQIKSNLNSREYTKNTVYFGINGQF